jgi:hypothetical protein
MAKSEEHLPHVTYVCGNGNAADNTDDDDTDDDADVCSLPLASNVKEATGCVVVFVGTSLLSYSSTWIIISTPYKCCFDDQFTTGDGGDAVVEEGTAAVDDLIVLIVASSTAVFGIVVAVSSTGDVTVEKKTVLRLLLPRLNPRTLLSLDSDVDMTRTDEKATQLSHDDDAQ